MKYIIFLLLMPLLGLCSKNKTVADKNLKYFFIILHITMAAGMVAFEVGRELAHHI